MSVWQAVDHKPGFYAWKDYSLNYQRLWKFTVVSETRFMTFGITFVGVLFAVGEVGKLGQIGKLGELSDLTSSRRSPTEERGSSAKI
ncbi:MAG: hypothetical protein O4805_01505 [Trichodesmium sp. St16_bin2-tuft]|nr:hypothetical protein [Trichodesmium sp. St16_bin2-tuft]